MYSQISIQMSLLTSLETEIEVGTQSYHQSTTEDHPRPAHAVLFVIQQLDPVHLVCPALARSPERDELPGIKHVQEIHEFLATNVKVVVGTYEPVVVTQVVLVHVLDHGKRLLQRRIDCVRDPGQLYDGEVGELRGYDAVLSDEEGKHADVLPPSVEYGLGPRGEIHLGGEDAHKHRLPQVVLLPEVRRVLEANGLPGVLGGKLGEEVFLGFQVLQVEFLGLDGILVGEARFRRLVGLLQGRLQGMF